MKKSIFLGSGLVVAIIIVAIISISSNKVLGPTGLTKASLRLKWITYIGWAGEYAAIDREFWKEEGLDIEVWPGGFEQDPIRLVPAGVDEFGVVGGDSLLMAREKGIPVVAIGLQYQISPAGFMVKASSGIRTPKDFEGRKVGISPGTDKHAVYIATLVACDVDRSKIIEIPVKFDLTPFFTDRVEVFPVFLSNQPIQAKDKGFDVVTIDPRDYGVSYMGNVYITTEKMIQEHPDTVRQFLRGVINAWDWCLNAPLDEVVKMICKYNSELNPDNQRKVWAASKPYLYSEHKGFGWMTKEQWEQTASIMQKQGMLKASTDIDSAFTTKFLEEIYTQK